MDVGPAAQLAFKRLFGIVSRPLDVITICHHELTRRVSNHGNISRCASLGNITIVFRAERFSLGCTVVWLSLNVNSWCHVTP